jgi:quercetin dioxygenase-like cupin family protein
MERLSFAAGIAPADPRLEGVTIARLTEPLAAGAPFQAAIVRLAPGGRIVRHAATVPQLLAVLEGGGVVSGGDGLEEPIVAGEAVVWAEGEEHETRSEAGLVALVLEAPRLAHARP